MVLTVGSAGSNGLPVRAICTNPKCGHIFVADWVFGGNLGNNISITGSKTNCPWCNWLAHMEDVYTDEKGVISYSGLAEIVKSMRAEDLKQLAKKLEAANEDFDGDELAAALVAANPLFNKFSQYLRRLSREELQQWLGLIVTVISLFIANSSLNLSKQQFVYQKERDAKSDEADAIRDAERAEINRKFLELEGRFDELLSKSEYSGVEEKRPPKVKATRDKSSVLKGCDRNKPCPCGSRRKAKKCHPKGLPSVYRT